MGLCYHLESIDLEGWPEGDIELADRCSTDLYVIIDQLNSDIPVYPIKF